MSICEVDATTVDVGATVEDAEADSIGATVVATDSGWLASGVDAITVGEADRSPARSNTGVGIGKLSAVVVDVAVGKTGDAATGAFEARVAIGAVEVTEVPSRIS